MEAARHGTGISDRRARFEQLGCDRPTQHAAIMAVRRHFTGDVSYHHPYEAYQRHGMHGHRGPSCRL